MDYQKRNETREASWKRHEERTKQRAKGDKLLGRIKLKTKLALEVFQKDGDEIDDLDFGMF